MKLEDVENRLLEELDECFIDFKINKKERIFESINSLSKREILFKLVNWGGRINLEILLRVDSFDVIDFFKKSTGKGLTPMITNNIFYFVSEGYFKKNKIIIIEEEKDLVKVIDNLKKAYGQILSFFKRFNTIEDFESIFNNYDGDNPYIVGFLHKNAVGLILAHLTKRDNYEDVEFEHDVIMEKYREGKVKDSYKKVREYINKINNE